MSDHGAAAGGALRWSRAAAVAAVSVSTAVAAHLGAGGEPPAWELVVALLGVVTCAVGPLLRHPAGRRRVVLLVLGGETLMHLALRLGEARSPGAAVPPAPALPMTGSMPGMDHVGAHGQGLATVAASVSAALGHDAVMTALHCTAAMAVGLWLAAGERAVWTLAALMVEPVRVAWLVLRTALRGTAPVRLVEGTSSASDSDRRAPALAVRACRVVSRRGPPAGLRLAA